MNSQNGWLLPHLPDLRQKPDSWRQQALWAFSPPTRAFLLMNWLKFKAWWGRVCTVAVGQSVTLSFFKLTSPGLAGRPFQGLHMPRPQGEAGLSLVSHSLLSKVFFPPACPVCLLVPVQACLQLLILSAPASYAHDFSTATCWPADLFLPFHSLAVKERNWSRSIESRL